MKALSLKTVCFLLITLLLGACSAKKNLEEKEEIHRKIQTAKINAQLGIAYLEQHEVQRSKQKLLLSLEQAPSIPEPWYAMAYFLETTGNKKKAQRYYLKAITLAPARGDVRNNYGTYLCRSGQYKAAVQQFLMATHDPNYLDPASAFENAGLCALKIPDKKMADSYFALAIKHDPSRKSLLKQVT